MTKGIGSGLVLVAVLTVSGCSGLSLDLLEEIAGEGSAQEIDRETVVAGLREALRVGSDRAVERTSAIDGFLANELIRIVPPEELDSMADALRRLGMGQKVDELEVAMNRAAERAASEAREVLWEEIRALTLSEAVEILHGGDTAATEHFRERSGEELYRRFQPIVVAKMDDVGLARRYGELAEAYNRLPLVKNPAPDLDEYVTNEALSGLFAVLGEEERKIRRDPLARTTALLRRVFGRTAP